LKTARQPAPESSSGEIAGLEAARARLDAALARLEKETAGRVAQVRAEAKGEAAAKISALETEIAKLKAEKRELEHANAELRKAAQSAGGRVDQAIADVRALLADGKGAPNA
jgi:chromosome segregation ATPase